ncbi:hypothetical protein DT73_18250 [Mangrovibacter sp. MFB070]|uniref:SDR family oxidoreductase n=1 Tax=Mangrovibacter sp. MFB070 TaxID=1224318 RepID=UPI0004DA8C1C|nr:SDR family oxidoreductase [Mangrovibacter sp. MFB070]KEA51305.1 hypothetical protein DT73_18250 [Mangrovibacter sp. MFB070]
MSQKTILIAGQEVESSLTGALIKHYSSQGYDVLFGECREPQAIAQEIDHLVTGNRSLSAFLYISPPPRQGNMLDDDSGAITATMNDDLELGLWWIQAISKKMIAQGTGGRIVTLAHIAALVPTERFSYGAASQLALMNLCRSAILDLVPFNIKINTVFRGFSETQTAEREFVEQLRVLHKDDGIPLLEYTRPEEIASTCYLLTDPNIHSFNGAMITMDSGFYVTRKIRYLTEI